MTTRRPMAPQNSRNAPFRSGMVTAISASRASPSSARSATKRRRSKFMLAPLSTATSTCPPCAPRGRGTFAFDPRLETRRRQRPGGLHDRARVVEDVLDGRAHFVVGDPDDFIDGVAGERKRELADFTHGDTVGEDAHVIEVDARAGLQRPAHRVSLERLDADHLHVRPQRLDVARDAGDEASTADRHEDGREMILAVSQDFGADGALPGDDERIVEGMDERHPRLDDEHVAVRLGIAVAVARQHHLGAHGSHRIHFDARRRLRHDDDRAEPELARREGDAL